MNRKVGVIGAGPAGLTAALKLQESGCKVSLFEASTSVGGMAKSIPLWGQIVDLGPHRFFSSDPRVNIFWLDVIGDEYVMVNRTTRIYYKKSFFSYPIEAFNAFTKLGPIEAIRCLVSYIYVQMKPKNDTSRFDHWVINKFGVRLFQIFFKSYTEKLWGIPCSELDADFAAQRIKKLSLFEAIKSAVFGGNKKNHRTLVDEFAYPKKGAGQVYELMRERFENLGGNIYLNHRVAKVLESHDKSTEIFIEHPSGETEAFDHIISTMPLTILVSQLDAPDHIKEHAKKLKFRNTILVYLQTSGANPFPDQWIYVHAPDLLTGRITNFSNWTKSIRNNKEENIICLEYWCYDYDSIWLQKDQDLIDRAKQELAKTGLVNSNEINGGHVVRVPRCYPVYERSYKLNLEPVEKYLSTIKNLSVIGRYGAFKYNNQDHSILMGILAAENVSNDSNHDLWSINTDYEYQESSRITATGLVRES